MNRQRARRSLFGLIVSITQTVSARICRLILKLWGGYAVENAVNFNGSKQYFFVANHQSRIDPFAVFGVLSLHDNFHIAPVRFMTARAIYKSILQPLLWLHGCYPTDRDREKVIRQSVSFVNEGYNLFMFPEGQRTLQSESDAKPGVRLILDAIAPEVAVVLTHIEWQRVGRWRRHVRIRLAEATTEERDGSPKQLMDAVYRV